MNKKFVILLLCLLAAPVIGLADKQNTAVDVVICVNSANGYSDLIDNSPWELAQAILEIPYDHELVRLANGYYFVGGKKLGYHGTWAAFLNIANDEWIAFETRAENDELGMFGASFVPSEVVAAFDLCGVDWGGYWAEEYPIVVMEPTITPLPDALRLPANPLKNGADLLPPTTAKNTDKD